MPLGEDAFVAAYASKCANSVCKTIDDMLDTPLAMQDKFVIWHYAFMRHGHVLHMIGWIHVGNVVKCVIDQVVQAPFHIMQQPDQADFLTRQPALPLWGA